jgi:hypothetical protein
MNGDEPIPQSQAICEFCGEEIFRRKLDGRWKHKGWKGHWARPREENKPDPKSEAESDADESTGSLMAVLPVTVTEPVPWIYGRPEPTEQSESPPPPEVDPPAAQAIELEAPEPVEFDSSVSDCSPADDSTSCGSSE